MNNLQLTKWLLKVRDALAEQDQVKRNSMLRAADRFLRGQSAVVRIPQDTNRRMPKGGRLMDIRPAKASVEPRARN
jgi:hypothetical protein